MKRSEFAITEAWKLYTEGLISWHDYVEFLNRYTEYENRIKKWEDKHK